MRLLWAVVLLCAAGWAHANDAKIGFVSTERLFREAAPAVRALKKLEKEFAPRDAELQKLAKQAKDLQSQLEKEGVTLSESDRRNKEQELARLNRDLQRMQREGYAHTLEAVAYTWFNRLAALRYMELHNYLGHGRRVLSNPEGGLPEVLTHALPMAERGELPGLRPATVEKLAATLREWLLRQGRRDEVAAALFVHPQTVRYRMGQLREAYGDSLDDPDVVRTLVIALGAAPTLGA